MTRELNGGQVRAIPLRVGQVEMPPTLLDKKYLLVDPARPDQVLADLVGDINEHLKRRG